MPPVTGESEAVLPESQEPKAMPPVAGENEAMLPNAREPKAMSPIAGEIQAMLPIVKPKPLPDGLTLSCKTPPPLCSEPILCPRLCGTLSSSYSSLDPFCYDYQLTCLYLVRQSVYISMSTCNIFSLMIVLKRLTSLHSAVPPTFRRRPADLPQ